ncbi:MAG TPA: TauD/TfdA family dioxygenase [Pyrinomonadaceae bacterium]|jgi:alpha-ketoglutarate-dependent taurine dioxygenase
MTEAIMSERTGRGGPGASRRRLVSVTRESMVETAPLFAGSRLPLVVIPSAAGRLDLAVWAADHREEVSARLAEHGGILFRGFGVRTAEEFHGLIAAVSGEALEYSERSSPRSRVAGSNIYTSTDYPASQTIFVHNENSYKRSFNQKIFFFCETAPARGGETPIADCRRVYERIPEAVRERFAQRGWMYVRNYGDGFGLDWPTAFQTDDPRAVEEHCRRNGIAVEWREGGRLRTHAVLPAVVRHPRTGEPVWFNHATFFHVSTLDPALRAGLLAGFEDEAELPTNTYYGDGSPIEPETLDVLREAYREETVSFAWERGDVLLLDNILAAHGRAPYEGARRILVGMTELINRSEARPEEL